MTTAEDKGDYYLVNGSKIFITNGSYADTYVIFAMTDKSLGNHGISAFILEKGMTISRPEALNALNTDVLTDLGKALDEVEANDDIYVVVLTGDGRSFVAGADIAQMRDFGAVEGKAFSDAGNALFLRIENMNAIVYIVLQVLLCLFAVYLLGPLTRPYMSL